MEYAFFEMESLDSVGLVMDELVMDELLINGICFFCDGISGLSRSGDG